MCTKTLGDLETALHTIQNRSEIWKQDKAEAVKGDGGNIATDSLKISAIRGQPPGNPLVTAA